MTRPLLEPGSTIGILGGGQLGAMFIGAARRMGYRAAVWDPDVDAPAHQLAGQSFTAPFSDHITREHFARAVQAVTLEWENIPAELCEWLEQHCLVRPSSAVLRVIQDRITQKRFLLSQSLPVPDFVEAESDTQLIQAIDRLGLPVLCKTAMSGYDGKGQWLLKQRSDITRLEEDCAAARSGGRWIIERFITLVRELSVLVVRNEIGECCVYPVAENRHEQGILRDSRVPAHISADEAKAAKELSIRAVGALQGVGVFCVELFQAQDGRLLINEIAPRPHNSGHYTLDACTVSQFEQQVRVTCGLSLGEARLLSPAVMVNLIGDEVTAVTSREGCQAIYSIPGAMVHLYGKRAIRFGRKMGHVTFTSAEEDSAVALAQQFMESLRRPSSLLSC